jgi:tetratricopeptide (TPR) repeat protein
MEDLNKAFNIMEQVIDMTPQDFVPRAGRLSNFGNILGRRFERTGSMEDLNRAVDVSDMAVNATPQDHPDRAGYLNNLGAWLGMRFKRTGSMEDLNRAVDVADIAVNATLQDHPDRAGRLNNFGTWLGMRFERTGSMDDFNRAVDVSDMAVNATPQDHPDRAGRLNNLGSWLGRRFERTGSMEDLNRAVDVANIGVNAAPQDHPDRAGRLINLGNLLGRRFERTGSMDDLNHALSHYKEGWSCHSSPPSIRIRSARHAADILASQRNWEESSEILQGAVQLLPLLSPRLLNNNDKQYILGRFAGLASMAAAISLKAGKDEHRALELLELGRCIIAGLLLEMRTDISLLKEQHSGLAAEFESLRDELDSPPGRAAPLGDAAPSWESQANRRVEADQKFNEVIMKIREQSGLQNFLLPPTYHELMAAADQGPIVTINVSSYRCDAFLIGNNRITVLPLPDLKEEELKEKAQQLLVGSTQTLQWLWDVAAGPILDALGHSCPPSHLSPPRVWWIPTGPLSHFPIHAAGYHTRGSTKTVLDRVMSSYGSSIKALVYGRRHSVRRATKPASEHALLVAMQETPCLQRGSALPFATREVEMLAGLCPSLELNVVRPLQRREEVLAHLRACKIFHFAGHGRSDPLDPSRSCLLLEDWTESPLTVGDLRDYKIQESSPFLGYLSACSTSANKVDKLVDEGIHLASAFQLAGFRHVIGTLWEVSDSHCVDVARVVYETIRDEGMTDKAVCWGLHLAVKALRDREVSMLRATRDGEVVHTNSETAVHIPLHWVPYVHFGV